MSSLLAKQLKALIAGDDQMISVLSNTAALLNDNLAEINWVGFYLMDEEKDELYLGPFQGKPACNRIPLGKGVCGTAARQRATIRVKDVDQFPGHIVCDSASKSEVVIPIAVGGKIFGVLDIDAPVLNRFSAEDQVMLEGCIAVLEEHLMSISEGTQTR